MKNDKLKEFIDREWDSINDEVPSDAVWQAIKKDLGSGNLEQRNIPYKLWALAASITLLLASGLFFLLRDGSEAFNAGPEFAVTEEEDTYDPLQNMGEDMIEVNRYYSVQVNERLDRLKAYEVDEDLMEEMSELAAEFEGLKLEMGERKNDAMIVEAMIENYRLRLSLLEDLLKALEPQSDEHHLDDEHEL
ncbi:MAG: hypothetical protein O2867_03090 [Bacteroidetes bacterium]|nr:hypothetical protein [Bacteroidota bacterium]